MHVDYKKDSIASSFPQHGGPAAIFFSPHALNFSVVAALNVCVCLHCVAAGWSTLMKRCEIQQARLPCLSTSTSRLPSCTRSSSWALFSCFMTAPAQNRWWTPQRLIMDSLCLIFIPVLFVFNFLLVLFSVTFVSHDIIWCLLHPVTSSVMNDCNEAQIYKVVMNIMKWIRTQKDNRKNKTGVVLLSLQNPLILYMKKHFLFLLRELFQSITNHPDNLVE